MFGVLKGFYPGAAMTWYGHVNLNMLTNSVQPALFHFLLASLSVIHYVENVLEFYQSRRHQCSLCVATLFLSKHSFSFSVTHEEKLEKNKSRTAWAKKTHITKMAVCARIGLPERPLSQRVQMRVNKWVYIIILNI